MSVVLRRQTIREADTVVTVDTILLCWFAHHSNRSEYLGQSVNGDTFYRQVVFSIPQDCTCHVESDEIQFAAMDEGG